MSHPRFGNMCFTYFLYPVSLEFLARSFRWKAGNQNPSSRRTRSMSNSVCQQPDAAMGANVASSLCACMRGWGFSASECLIQLELTGKKCVLDLSLLLTRRVFSFSLPLPQHSTSEHNSGCMTHGSDYHCSSSSWLINYCSVNRTVRLFVWKWWKKRDTYYLMTRFLQNMFKQARQPCWYVIIISEIQTV